MLNSVFRKIFKNKLNISLFEKKIILFSALILVFNIIDGVLTIWGIHLNLIKEGNPLMQLLIENNLVSLVMVIKILLPIILGVACWGTRNASRKLVSYGLGGILIVYMLIMMAHVRWIYAIMII